MFTILIVEDNIIVREALREMLRTRYPTMNVSEATDASEALEIVNAAVPDLIFMDISLPGTNGLKVTRKIKKDNPQVPVVILGSYDLEEYREEARRAGADFFIPKGSSIWKETTALVESILIKAELLTHCPAKEDA